MILNELAIIAQRAGLLFIGTSMLAMGMSLVISRVIQPFKEKAEVMQQTRR